MIESSYTDGVVRKFTNAKIIVINLIKSIVQQVIDYRGTLI